MWILDCGSVITEVLFSYLPVYIRNLHLSHSKLASIDFIVTLKLSKFPVLHAWPSGGHLCSTYHARIARMESSLSIYRGQAPCTSTGLDCEVAEMNEMGSLS